MSTQVGDDPFDIGDLWSTDEEGPTDGPCPTPLGPLDSKSMGDIGLERHDVLADGNCMVHAFLKNQRGTSHAAQSMLKTRERVSRGSLRHMREPLLVHIANEGYGHGSATIGEESHHLLRLKHMRRS